MRQFKSYLPIAVFLVGFVCTSWSQESYIQPESLDIETIKQEEMMDESSVVTRVYIFLAIWNGSAYETYATSGNNDLDNDGAKALEEPNDLDEYEHLTHQKNNKLEIPNSEHISYINSMPYFSELFPNQDNPFESTDLIEVETEESFSDGNHLKGTTTISVFNRNTGTVGVERFIAFYNKKEGDSLVTSYGFASVQIVE